MTPLRSPIKLAGASVLACTLTLALAACNSGGSDSSTSAPSPTSNPPASSNATGVFLDAPVQGLRVERSSGASGTTGSFGEFAYTAGESVTFYLGNLKLGTVVAKAEITPLDLFNTSDSNNRKVVNLLRLLQSLDSNDNLSNGIQLSDTTLQAANPTLAKLTLDQDTTLFEKSTDVATVLSKKRPGLTLTSLSDAKAHFDASRLTAAGAGFFSGTLKVAGQSLTTSGMAGVTSIYNGSYTPADKKNYTVVLDKLSNGSARLQLFSTTSQTVGSSVINVPDVKEETGTLTLSAGEIRFSGNNGGSLSLTKTAAAAMTGVKGYYQTTGNGTATLCPNGSFIAALPEGYGVKARQYIGLAYFGSNGLQYALKPLISLGSDETVTGALKLNDASIEFTLPTGTLKINKVSNLGGLALDICS